MHLRQIDVETIDKVGHHWSGCVDGNAISILDQLDIQWRCWKVDQIGQTELLLVPQLFSPFCFYILVAENEPWLVCSAYIC